MESKTKTDHKNLYSTTKPTSPAGGSSPGQEVASILKTLLLRCREAQLQAAAHCRAASVEA